VRTLRTLVTAGALGCALFGCAPVLWANDALDFWREEYSRQNRSRAVESPPPDIPLRFTVRPPRDHDPRGALGGSSSGFVSGHLSGSPYGQHYCVRTCDGFYFPLSASGGITAKADMCRALCPGAPTEVYRLSSGAESIESAVSERGKAYASLPTALAYRKSLKPGCSCRSSTAVAMSVPITKDPTLARGDIVVTSKGVHIFAGGAKFPFRDSDFVHYRKYPGLPREVSAMLSLIDRPFQQAELKHTLNAPRDADKRAFAALESGDL
jgi:Protein of unknown function (DUF2865)